MNIANGFITQSVKDAYQEVCNRSKAQVLPVPLPTVDTMTYWLSDKGEMWGCQRMKNMCLTKPLRIERRCKKGCSIRYSIGKGKQAQVFMQNVVWSTFVAKQWLPELDFSFKDGNQYNFHLENLELIKPQINHLLVENMKRLQGIYRGHFLSVAWYIRKHDNSISLEDCKDIASEAFFYLCGFRDFYPDNFIGLWKRTTRRRAIDWLKKSSRSSEGILWEDNGEERYGAVPKDMTETSMWSYVRGQKRNRIMRLYDEGLTPTEIAEATNSTLGTVGGFLSRTIKDLQRIYAKDIAICCK